MPAAGDIVRALDFPPAQYTRNSTTVTGQGAGDTDYESISPEIGVAFIAPTSGQVEVVVWAGLRVSASTGRAMADFEVREDDASGAVVRSTNSNPMISSDTDNYEYRDGASRVGGLTPGGTYFARVMTRSSTSATEYDFSDRSILVKPLP